MNALRTLYGALRLQLGTHLMSSCFRWFAHDVLSGFGFGHMFWRHDNIVLHLTQLIWEMGIYVTWNELRVNRVTHVGACGTMHKHSTFWYQFVEYIQALLWLEVIRAHRACIHSKCGETQERHREIHLPSTFFAGWTTSLFVVFFTLKFVRKEITVEYRSTISYYS